MLLKSSVYKFFGILFCRQQRIWHFYENIRCPLATRGVRSRVASNVDFVHVLIDVACAFCPMIHTEIQNPLLLLQLTATCKGLAILVPLVCFAKIWNICKDSNSKCRLYRFSCMMIDNFKWWELVTGIGCKRRRVWETHLLSLPHNCHKPSLYLASSFLSLLFYSFP